MNCHRCGNTGWRKREAVRRACTCPAGDEALVVDALSRDGLPRTVYQLHAWAGLSRDRLQAACDRLVASGVLVRRGGRYHVKEVRR